MGFGLHNGLKINIVTVNRSRTIDCLIYKKDFLVLTHDTWIRTGINATTSMVRAVFTPILSQGIKQQQQGNMLLL